MSESRRDYHVRLYRERALVGDSSLLSGRTGSDQTERRADIIYNAVTCNRVPGDVIDIGCGDATLAFKLSPYEGTVSTPEEFDLLLAQDEDLNLSIAVLPERTYYVSELFDTVVCSGVLLFMSTLQEFAKAVRELVRITKHGGMIFLGELPRALEKNHLSLSHYEVVNTCNLLRLKYIDSWVDGFSKRWDYVFVRGH